MVHHPISIQGLAVVGTLRRLGYVNSSIRLKPITRCNTCSICSVRASDRTYKSC